MRRKGGVDDLEGKAYRVVRLALGQLLPDEVPNRGLDVRLRVV